MKKLFILTIFASSNVFAQVDCGELSKLAETTMQLRQTGAPIREVISIFQDTPPQVYPLVEFIVLEAYKVPLVSDPKLVTSEFGSAVFIQCLKARK